MAQSLLFLRESRARLEDLLPPLLIFLLAIVVFGIYSFDGMLTRDRGIFMYAGQMIADGVPPYVSIFDFQGPIGPMIAGLGVILSRAMNWDDLYTVRLIFSLLGCITVVIIYFLGQSLFESKRAGVFSALVFLGFAPFVQIAASGPQTKTPMVLFVALNLLLTSERRWFWAGLFGSLAALTWQPTAIFPATTLFLAMTSTPAGRREAVLRTLAGIGLPLLFILAYFAYYGAIYLLLEGSILAPVLYARDGNPSLLTRFLKPVRTVFSGYETMTIPVFIGWVIIGYFYFWRKSELRSLRDALTKDRFAPLLLSFPVPFLWSLIDFESAPDFFIFLPYIAIGFGYFLETALQGTKESARKYLAAGLCIAFGGLAIISRTYFTEEMTLDEQRTAAQEILLRFGEEVKLATIGAPELMAILHRTNPTRYLYVAGGVGDLIQATTRGGFGGWLKQLGEYYPDLLVLGRTSPEAYRQEVMEWLASDYHEVEELNAGKWRVFVLNSLEQ